MRFNQPGIRQPSAYINSMAIVASTAERQALPTGYQFVVINSTSNTYVKLGDASVEATIPGDVTDGTSSELNPMGYSLLETDATHISVISPLNGIVTLGYYTLV